MRRLTPVAVVLLLAGCGSSHSVHHVAGKATVHLAPGTQKVFSAGVLRQGDIVKCGSFSAVVQRPGSAVSAGQGQAGKGGKATSVNISIQANADGTVVAKCGR